MEHSFGIIVSEEVGDEFHHLPGLLPEGELMERYLDLAFKVVVLRNSLCGTVPAA